MDEITERQRLDQIRLDQLRRAEDDEFYEDQQASEKSGAKGMRNRAQAAFSDEAPSAGTLFQGHAAVHTDSGERTVPNKKKRLTGLWLLLGLMLAAMAYTGYGMLRPTEALPRLPSFGATSGEPAFSLPQASVQRDSESLQGTVLPIETPAQEPTGVAAPIATSTDAEHNARLDRLEALAGSLIEGLRVNGYITTNDGVGELPLTAASFAPYRAAPAPAAAAPVRHAPVRKVAQSKPAPAKPVAQPTTTGPSQQLLSVDLWNGRPSVVVSNGDPRAPLIKVMQPGDTFNGITLNSADVATQRATFSDGARSISLDAAQ